MAANKLLPTTVVGSYPAVKSKGLKSIFNPYAAPLETAVSDQVKHQRSQRLLALSEQKRLDFYARAIGQVRPVLTEHSHSGFAAKGFTDNYIHVVVPTEAAESRSNAGPSTVADNAIIPMRLTGFSADRSALIGTIEE